MNCLNVDFTQSLTFTCMFYEVLLFTLQNGLRDRMDNKETIVQLVQVYM